MAMRNVWAQTLIDIAREDDRVVLLDGDLGSSTKGDQFAEAIPERFLQMGIAEQNMVGAAAGLATVDLQPWVSTFGAFLTYRAGDALRVAVAQTGLDVKFAAAYTGVCIGMAGKTHHDQSDVALLRTMPGMTVMSPGDDRECAALTRHAHELPGPVYLRLARDDGPDLPDPDGDGGPAEIRVLRQGSDLTFVSTGIQSTRTLAAAEDLARSGIDARVVHVPVLHPLQPDALCEAVPVGPVVTTEEHSSVGGLGGIVAEALTSRPGAHGPILRIGVDTWIETGGNDHLLDLYGLSTAAIVTRVRNWMASPDH